MCDSDMEYSDDDDLDDPMDYYGEFSTENIIQWTIKKIYAHKAP